MLCTAELIEDCLKKFFSCYVCPWEADGIACVINSPSSDSLQSSLNQAVGYTTDMLMRYLNQSVDIGIGSFTSIPEKISDSFMESLDMCGRSATPGKAAHHFRNDVVSSPQASEFHLCEYQDQLINAFNSYDTPTFKALINEIITNYMQADFSLQQAISVCSSFLYFTSILIPGYVDFITETFGAFKNPIESINSLSSSQDAIAWMNQLCEALCMRIEKNLLRSKNWLVPNIIEYINTHSSEALSLQEIADIFDKSPAYISTLFKKHSNIGFSEYVRTAKLTHAKKLLSEGKKVKEVSEQLGFSDPYYFSRIFKKAEGISPSEYALLSIHK